MQAWLLQKVGEEGRGGGTRAAPRHRNQVSLLLFPAIIPAKLGEHTPGAIAQRLRFMILSPGKYEFIPAAPASPLGLHVACQAGPGYHIPEGAYLLHPQPLRCGYRGAAASTLSSSGVGWEGLLRQRLSGGQGWPSIFSRTVSELGTCKPFSFTGWA